MVGRDFEARMALETGCRRLSTRMNEGPPFMVVFSHDCKQGAVYGDPHRAPAVNVRLGAEHDVLTVSPLAEISYRGTPIVRLQGPELRAANDLVDAALGGLERHKPVNGQATRF